MTRLLRVSDVTEESLARGLEVFELELQGFAVVFEAGPGEAGVVGHFAVFQN